MKDRTASEWKFVGELRRKQPFEFRWCNRKPQAEEVDFSSGIRFPGQAPFPRLATVWKSFERFLKNWPAKTSGNPLPLCFSIQQERLFESYDIVISERGIDVQAGDSEGIRRALYHLEDLFLSADAPYLKKGTLSRKPWLKNRISRCFFSPIKRAPHFRDELADKFDYYPEAYLERLASEGINGLWITVEWKELASTSFTKPSAGTERRLAKLRSVADRCLEYGIRIFVFCIEPAAFAPDSSFLKKHPEFGGCEVFGKRAFCLKSAHALQYIRESVGSIFQAIPKLGGMINISHGERPTTCLSSCPCTQDVSPACRGNCGFSNADLWKRAVEAMRDGMKEFSPDADLISWLYMPEGKKRAEWVFTLARNIPEGVILQYNFESNINAVQLGKIRNGGDYWLSQAGPSADFEKMAFPAKEHRSGLSAKLQVGCSHEVATVPIVPVPGILYRKYRKMREMNVRHVMQCWYFGNYPGLMNKAAGHLAFEEFAGTETDFLRELARPVWGSATETAVEAWTLFADAYGNYPLSNMFQYYGPAHAGTVWEWQFDFRLKPLAPTWHPSDSHDGDAIGECLREHSLGEAVILTRTLSEKWTEGVRKLTRAVQSLPFGRAREKSLDLARALEVQFASVARVLQFYELRSRFASEMLPFMRILVSEEIAGRKALAELCARDSSLGFHSEAEGYLYSREMLSASIPSMEKLLERLGAPFAVPQMPERKQSVFGQWTENRTFRWKLEKLPEKGHLKFTLESMQNETPRVFELALCDRTLSEPVRFLSFKNSGVIQDHLKCIDAQWDGGTVFEAEFPSPYPKLSGSVSCAEGPHDFEYLYDAWPRRPGDRKSQLRLGLRYFHPGYTGDFM
ncbi:MAG: hypothetical protein BWY31_02931 [Lentisphaerae bacterium ADurb.Bin242]|nr:MAG: hypothetical protein BWY31_02931 [Lentisphaerae bacterium ADurb.Bin242]